jgi:hypothetical protein
MKQHNYPDIETYLEPKMEGNIYSVLNITKELPKIIFESHYYLVKGGKVYEMFNLDLIETDLTLLYLELESRYVGKYGAKDEEMTKKNKGHFGKRREFTMGNLAYLLKVL